MQLTSKSVSIPKVAGELFISADKLKKLRKSGFPLEWFILFAIQLSYGTKNPSILIEHFCEDWGVEPSELDVAIARLQKKGLAHRPSDIIQLELFGEAEQDDA